MEVGGGTRSSSIDLSSPPSDPEQPDAHAQLLAHLPAIQFAAASTATPATAVRDDGVAGQNSSVPGRQDAPAKVRKPRKKKDETPEAAKEKKPRKPRLSTVAATIASRKKQAKLDSAGSIVGASATATASVSAEAAAGARAVAATHPPIPIPDLVTSSALAPARIGRPPLSVAAEPSQNGFSIHTEPIASNAMHHAPRPVLFQPPPPPPPPVPPQRTGGLSYDPVRSMTVPRPTDTPQKTAYSEKSHPHTPTLPVFRPTASPTSISSIIDPPDPPPQFIPSPPTLSRSAEQPPVSTTAAMEIDPPTETPNVAKKPPLVKRSSSDGPSNAPSPKPTRAKEQPPPLPQGSGLLSSALFGGAAAAAAAELTDATVEKAPSIILHVDLKGQNNKVINFARLAEEKYGFAALYPRLAAQKSRLARVAAAGAALERSTNSSKVGGTSTAESGDEDVSVDIDRDSDNDGDVIMSGMNGGADASGASGTEGPVTKRKRKKKMEEYDQEDPFVDDSELAWEAQAAASKDGFFVYCGPLVPEGEKPAVERADGTVKRGRGRGRGGGPGSRGGRGGGASTAEPGPAKTGAGTRGGTVTRKPRMTKASRLLLEREKAEREKMAPIAAKPSGYPT